MLAEPSFRLGKAQEAKRTDISKIAIAK
jgi:hypothetical protein